MRKTHCFFSDKRKGRFSAWRLAEKWAEKHPDIKIIHVGSSVDKVDGSFTICVNYEVIRSGD